MYAVESQSSTLVNRRLAGTAVTAVDDLPRIGHTSLAVSTVDARRSVPRESCFRLLL